MRGARRRQRPPQPPRAGAWNFPPRSPACTVASHWPSGDVCPRWGTQIRLAWEPSSVGLAGLLINQVSGARERGTRGGYDPSGARVLFSNPAKLRRLDVTFPHRKCSRELGTVEGSDQNLPLSSNIPLGTTGKEDSRSPSPAASPTPRPSPPPAPPLF
ncbi:unnamed protein product [Rangifer tarandus platyrhynchus]|uniref:Uncharacterized protein n=2 Tax=Rangifer tarandus platyrhynchus TaxID=3082113 RepID=A0ABN8ZB21_RANTA|nr:unnamed protein product [Rangifer tarandus platyrhynchus]CAI9703944.1 unnamed protein product [Rangifer tarandus platyrhynchus]